MILAITFSASDYAGTYKCSIEGKTAYQDTPCEETGGIGKEIDLPKDISVEQQKRAVDELNRKIQERHQMEKARYDTIDKERKIQAEEKKAIELEKRNYIEANKPPPTIIINY